MTSATTTRTFAFAGGGSGGHISPGLAIAERLRELAPQTRAIFLCSTRSIDAEMLREADESFVPLPATAPGLRPGPALRFLLNYRASRQQMVETLRAEHVDHVVALGGFVAAPVVAAAKACGIPVTLINLDAPPGKANRWIARSCDAVWSAVELPMLPRFASAVVGVPIRRRTLAPDSPEACRAMLGLAPEKPTLLVTGASQGAVSINAVMRSILSREPSLLRNWQVHHIAGRERLEPIRDIYRRVGVPAVVEAFRHDMGPAWGAATLVISRAGANSVAEILANAVPAIFLPYPHHRDQHQRRNAEPLEQLGGAIVLEDAVNPEQNASRLLPVLRKLLPDRSRLETMHVALKAHAPGDAAGEIAQRLLDQSATPATDDTPTDCRTQPTDRRNPTASAARAQNHAESA